MSTDSPLHRLVRASLDAEEPLHDAIALLRSEVPGKFDFLRQLRVLTGLSLDDAVAVMGHLDGGGRLHGHGWQPLRDYLGAGRVRSWILRIWLRDAVVDGRPYLWVESAPGGGLQTSSTRDRPTGLAPRQGSSTVSFSELHADLADALPDPRIQVVEEGHQHVVFFFPSVRE